MGTMSETVGAMRSEVARQAVERVRFGHTLDERLGHCGA